MIEMFDWMFVGVREFILWIASALKYEAMPGLLASSIFAFSIAAALLVWSRSFGIVNRIKTFRAAAEAYSDEAGFARGFARFEAALPENELKKAWKEFAETTIPEQDAVLNTVRPAAFFNAHDLGYSLRWGRYVPGLLVSIGLALTFLGLIAALEQTGQSLKGADDAQISSALEELLTVASAKFIMSLSGLVCSIGFSALWASTNRRIERALHDLCGALEKRMLFQTAEKILREQLSVAKSHKDDFKMIATDMVAELSRPLREELPQTIGASISSELKPLLEGLQRQSSDGVGDMVRDLSERFSGQVGDAMETASTRLAAAGETLGALLQEMKSSLESGGNRFVEDANRASRAIADAGDALSRKAHEELLTPIGAARDALEAAAGTMTAAVNGMNGLAENTERSAAAAKDAASSMETAGSALRKASEPVVAAAERFEATSRHTSDAVARTAEALMASGEQTATQAARALEAARAAIGDERDVVAATLTVLNDVAERFAELAARHDEIDQKLGAAFAEFQDKVRHTVDLIDENASGIHKNYGDTLNVLRGIIDDAREFRPEAVA